MSGTNFNDDDVVFPTDLPQLAPDTSLRILADNGQQAGFIFQGSIEGAAQALAGLTDTNITTLQDGFVLIYNATSGKWTAGPPPENMFDGGNY
jgi:hypothetical protein